LISFSAEDALAIVVGFVVADALVPQERSCERRSQGLCDKR
jgi:hypothetical protein